MVSANNSGLNLNIAINYGGRAEIINAIKEASKNGDVSKITEQEFEKYLYNANIPNVDLLIRTGGDQRVSNFLLWQVCYAELYFTQKSWPDFDSNEFKNILHKVGDRERRFGAVSV